jgi:UDP-glucose 4-epimerase
MKAFVTGAAGFIGSHIVDELIARGWEVIGYDNLTTGFERHLEPAKRSGRLTLIQGDILDGPKLNQDMSGIDTVFHLAANADVRGGRRNREIDLKINIEGSHNVLEAAGNNGVRTFVFTSSATVYGEPDQFPTPETYAGMQTSLYGASKLAAEGYTQAYSEYYGMRSFMFRFVSWIGERYSHGVIFDFMNKLRRNPKELEILGDGNQKKSYLHVKDGVSGLFSALDNSQDLKNLFNLGHLDHMNVKDLADIICDEMGLTDVEYRFTGGSRGWLGDSPFVLLDIERIMELGFKPLISIEDGVRKTVRYLLENQWLLDSRK